MIDTRTIFFKEVERRAETDKDIIVLVGDLGYSFMEGFAERFPDQFINCGIAEQNMVGVAAGLARVGKKPFVYSGAMFLCTRALEQIRDDVCYANLDVKLIGTGAAGFLGFSHNFEGAESSYEIIRPLPNIRYHKAGVDEYLPSWLEVEGPMFIQL